MNDAPDTDEYEPLSESRRIMFAYLAGMGSPEWRAQAKAAYEKAHATHTERYGNCALCEKQAMIDALSYESPLLRGLPTAMRAKRFRNTGKRHHK